MACKLPKCYKSQKNKCSLPNPWIVFNKNYKFTSKTAKDNAYLEFKSYLQDLKHKDEIAYRAALCLYKKKEKNEIAKMKTKLPVVSAFVKRLMKERKEINMECKMTPNLVEFFEKFVPTSIMGATTLTPCQVIAKYMLGRVVSKDELKYYTFQDNMGMGAHGLLLSGTYKQNPVAVKIIPVHSVADTPYKLSFTINGKNKALRSVSEENILREFNLQKAIGNVKFSTFKVPAVHGNVSVMKAKTGNNRVAVLVMDKVTDEIDMEKMTFEEQCNSVAKIPCILHKLHKKGFIHGDLHMWNLLITNKNTPYVIDFGRSVNMSNTTIKNEQDLKMLTIMDYIIPIEMILRGVSSSTYENAGNMLIAYLNGMKKCSAKKEIDTLLKQIDNDFFNRDVNFVIKPINKESVSLAVLKEIYNIITDLRFEYYYSGMTKNWGDVLKI